MLLISDLINLVDSYLDKESVANIYRAYLFGASAHEGQTRKTGEAYIHHPIAVAEILANMGCDADIIIAAILHDVIEDTTISKEQVSKKFGIKVAHMVDGVSKLAFIQHKSKKQAQADNFRKMMLAISSDIRIILIKIADRLHNMRTLYGMPPNKRKRISKETLDIYIPLAERLGMYTIKLELEQLVLQNLYPWRHKILDKTMHKIRKQAQIKNNAIKLQIKNKLKSSGIESRLLYREKSLFSAYRKMQKKRTSLADLDDIFALRIIVTNTKDCYHALGIIHSLHKPILGKFKDYIAIPKSNGYQSLHTVLFIKDGYNIEVQIRTESMDKVAESGIASHWEYKNQDNHNPNDVGQEWLQQVAELQRTAKDAEEFLENIKFDLFKDKVFVFSPHGKIFELPRGATALDFAYAVHTEIGNHCFAVKINSILVDIGTKLKNGETIDIITTDHVMPSLVWLDMVVTGKAIANIKHHVRSLEKHDAIKMGKKILAVNLSKYHLSIEKINYWKQLLGKINMGSMEQLYEAIALGKCSPSLIRTHILKINNTNTNSNFIYKFLQKISSLQKKPNSIAISGTEGLVVQYASCCMPLPGDKIMGIIQTDNGLMVHRRYCKYLQTQNKSIPISLHWAPDIDGTFLTEIFLKFNNQIGALAKIASVISQEGADISAIDVKKSGALIQLHLKDRQHLAQIIKILRKLTVVQKINRAQYSNQTR